jgi:hypothetical protein
MADSCKLEVKWSPYGRGAEHVRGPAYKMTKLPIGAEGKYGPITKYTSDWARTAYVKMAECVTLQNPRQSGHEIEGFVNIGGKRYSAFTSSDDPSGLIVRTQRGGRRRR